MKDLHFIQKIQQKLTANYFLQIIELFCAAVMTNDIAARVRCKHVKAMEGEKELLSQIHSLVIIKQKTLLTQHPRSV